MNKFLQQNLQIILTGLLIGIALQAGAQTFTDATSGTGLENIPIRNRNCIQWADYNNDGYLDLFIVGDTTTAEPVAASGKIFRVYKNNGNSTFSEVTNTAVPSITPLTAANISFADYNNDGYLDFAYCGTTVKTAAGNFSTVSTKIYKNSGSPNYIFQEIPIKYSGLMSISTGVLSWGDYDHDGDLDLFISGRIDGFVTVNSNNHKSAKMFKNEGNDVFTDAWTFGTNTFSTNRCANLVDINNDGWLDASFYGYPSVRSFIINKKDGTFTGALTVGSWNNSSSASGVHTWADFNNDGKQDILFGGGETNTPVVRYRLFNATATTTTASVSQIGAVWKESTIAWANNLNDVKVVDYDNDGKLDFSLNKGGDSRLTDSIFLYKNIILPTMTATDLPFQKVTDFPATVLALKNTYSYGNTWGDYDRDGKIDIVIPTDAAKVVLYKSSVATANTKPVAPTTLPSVVSGSNVTLNWNAATDTETPQNGITYELRIGTKKGGTQIVSPLTDPSTGFCRIPAAGQFKEAMRASGYLLKQLAAGTYYWSVNAVDGGYAGSAWAIEDSFKITSQQASNIVLSNVTSTTMTISWTSGNEANRAVFMKAAGDVIISPIDSAITPNTVFGTAGSKYRNTGWYCVYAGSGSTVDVTGLAASTPYTIAVLEYSGSGATIKYNTSPATDNPFYIQVPQTITFGALAAKNFGDAAFTLGATGGASGLPVTYTSSNIDVAKISGSQVTIIAAGETDITALQAGNLGYLPATPVIQKLTVNKKVQTIIFNSLSAKVMGDAAFDLAATGGTSGNAIAYSSSNTSVATISGKTVTIVGVGTTDITATQLGNANHLDATPVMQTLTVNKGAQTITFGTLPNKNVTDPAFDLSATGGASGNAITYSSSNTSVATISGKTVTLVGAGSTDITASQLGNSNYTDATPVMQTLTVSSLPAQTITFDVIPAKTFGDATFDLSATGGASGNAVTFTSSNTAVATVSGKTVTIVGAGSSDITANQAGNANYAAAAPVIQTLNVAKASQSITFSALANKVFGDPAFNLSATGGASGNAVTFTSSNTAVATISGNTVTMVGVGITDITAAQVGNANYSAATSVIQKLTVTKLLQTITFNALSTKNVGDPSFTLSATGGASGNAVTYSSSNTSVATISGNTVTIVGAGSTDITASQAGNTNYDNATPVVQKLTVNKLTQTITFNALSTKNAGDPSFTLSATGGASGNAVTFTSSNTSVATISGNTVTIVGGGTTDITASQAGNTNYDNATPVVQKLTVNKLAQTITFNALSAKTVGDPSFTLSATGGASGNAVTFTSSNTSVATISGNTVTIVGGGTTDITANQLGNGNYDAATAVTRTLTVNKLGQTIVFNTIPSKTVGDAAFTLSATGGASGNAVTFASANTNIATISGNTLTIVGGGTTTITASQLGNSTYNEATPVVLSFTVNKASQTISFASLADKKFSDGPLTLNATASSNLPVSYTSSNNNIATVDGNKLIFVGVGSVVIKASQAGNNSYFAAADSSRTLKITKGVNIITFKTIPGLKTDSADYKLETSASSGLKIIYECSDTSVAIIKSTTAGSFIHAKLIGTATIKATQPGNDLYEAATAVSQALTVTKPTAIEDPVIRGLKLYPNPVGDKFNVSFTEAFSNANIDVYSASGALLITKNLNNSFTEISASQLPSGMYLVKILVNNKIVVKKIMKR